MKGEIFVYLCVVLGSLGALRRPIVGLFVYVAFAMLRPQFLWGWAGDLGPVSFIVGSAVLVGWAFRGLGSWKFGRGRAVVLALVLFWLWSGLSAIVAVSSSTSWEAMNNLSKVVLPFLVGATILESAAQARALMWVIVLCEGYVALQLNLPYLQSGVNVIQEHGFGGMDNNSFAVSLVCTVGPAVALAIAHGRWWMRGLAAASALLILHAALLSFSRGGMIGLIAVGVTALVVMPKRPRYLIPLALAAILAIRLTGPELVDRLGSAFTSEGDRDVSAQSRLDLWRDCLTVAVSHPVFGVGPSNWPIVASSFGWTPGKQAHSVWMQTAAETGFVGVSALLAFFVIAGWRLWQVVRARGPSGPSEPDRLLAVAAMTSIAGYLVSGQFVSMLGLETPYYVTIVGVVLLRVLTPVAAIDRPAAMPARVAGIGAARLETAR